MAKNVGTQDRVVRIVAGLVIGVGAYLGGLPQTAIYVLWVVAAYLVLTGLFAWDLLYKLIDVDTTIQEQPYSTTDDRAGL
jgi:phage shock protein PspC (stress-responsive transcriptional regulator)